MQAFLITLASAIILAIVVAFTAPFVVDWNAWRATFETQASRIIGAPVLIRGGIEAELLPMPRVVLRQVSVGADAVSTGGTIEQLRINLTLGALLRGAFEAQSLTLIRPSLRLVLDSSGQVALPPGSGASAGLSIARLGVEQGRLEILDRGSDRAFSLTGMDLKGEAGSLSGPFRLEGELTAGGRRQNVRLSLGKMGRDPARLRLSVDDRSRALTLDLDGAIGLDLGAPRYEGRATLIHRASQEKDVGWRVVAGLRTTSEAIVAETVDLTLGDEAQAPQMSGSARLSLGRAPRLDMVLNAQVLDLDPLILTATSGRAPADLVADLAVALTGLDPPAIAVRIGAGVEQLTLGGTVVREARLDLSGDASAWRLDGAQAWLPGQALLRLTGGKEKGPSAPSIFSEMLLTAEDPAAFLRWAVPGAPVELVRAVKGPVRVSGRLGLAEDGISISNLAARFAAATVSGSASYRSGTPARLDVALALDGVDLDPVVSLARIALASGLPVTGDIALSGRNLSLSGLPLGMLNVAARAEGQGWTISHLDLDDLDGLGLEGQGVLTRMTPPMAGQMNFRISGARAQGLEPLARIMAGETVAGIVHRLLPVANSVGLAGDVEWRADGSSTLRAKGRMGQIEGSLDMRADGPAKATQVDVSMSAADGARVLDVAGLSGLKSGQGPGRLDLSVRRPVGGDLALDGRLVLGEAVLAGTGILRAADPGFEPDLALRLTGADLSTLFAAAAASGAGPLPADLAFTLRSKDGRWLLQDFKGQVAGAPVSGTIGVEPGAIPRLTGQIEVEEVSVPGLLELWGARGVGADAAPGLWSATRFALTPGPTVSADLRLQARRLALTNAYKLTDAGLRLVTDGSTLELRDLAGAFGGGRLAGMLLLRPGPDGLAAQGHLALTNVESAALLAPLAPKNAPRGRVSLMVDLAGSGRSPQLLLQSLGGQGTLAVKDLEIAAADPSAIAAVLAATAVGAPPDERRTAQLFDRALARGPLRVAALESTFGVVNGVVRVSPARALLTQGREPDSGQVRVSVSANLDLVRLILEASLDLEAAPLAGAAPGGTLTWRGPVGGPERQVTASALTSVIAMRAIERETRRLEDRQRGDGGLSVPSAGMPTDPAVSSAPPAVPVPSPMPRRAPSQSTPSQSTPNQSAPSQSVPQGASGVSRAGAPIAASRDGEGRLLAPPLPAPVEIAPTVQPRAAKPLPQSGLSAPFAMPDVLGGSDVFRPQGLVPGQ